MALMSRGALLAVSIAAVGVGSVTVGVSAAMITDAHTATFVLGAALGAGAVAVTFDRYPQATLLCLWWALLLTPAVSQFLGTDSASAFALSLLDDGAAVVLPFVASVRPTAGHFPRAAIIFGWGFITAGLIGGMLAVVPLTTLALGTLGAAKFLILTYVCLRIDWTPAWRRRFLSSIRLALAIVTVGAVLNVVSPAFFQSFFQWEREEGRLGAIAVQSIFSHPAHLGEFGGFAFVVLITHYLRTRNTTHLYYGIMAFTLCISSLRLKSIITVLVALAILAIIDHRSFLRRLGLITATGLAIAVITGGGLIYAVAVYRVGTVTAPDNSAPRNALYSAAFDITGEHFPFGVGFGRFGSAAAKHDYSPVYTEFGFGAIPGLDPDHPVATQDAQWASILGETGWLGASCMAAWIFVVVREFWKIARRNTRGIWTLVVPALALTVAQESISSPGFTFAPVGLSLALAIGCAARESIESDTPVHTGNLTEVKLGRVPTL